MMTEKVIIYALTPLPRFSALLHFGAFYFVFIEWKAESFFRIPESYALSEDGIRGFDN